MLTIRKGKYNSLVGQINNSLNFKSAFGTSWFAPKGSESAFFVRNPPMKFYVYLLKCRDGSYYVGKGQDNRWKESVLGRRGVELCFQHFVNSEKEAFRLEDKVWCEMTKRGYEMENKERPQRCGHWDQSCGRGRRLTYNNQCLTIPEWAEKLGVKKGLIQYRLARGWSVEKTLTTAPSVRLDLITHNGVTKSISEWVVEISLPYYLIHQRLKKGLKSEKVLSKPVSTILTYEGLSLTVREWSKRTGLDAVTIRNRLRKGYSIKDVLSPPHQMMSKKHCRTLTHNDKTMTIGDWACTLKIPSDVLWSRLKRGLSVDRVLNQPYCPRSRTCIS